MINSEENNEAETETFREVNRASRKQNTVCGRGYEPSTTTRNPRNMEEEQDGADLQRKRRHTRV